jgi:Rieske Fe-S protein
LLASANWITVAASKLQQRGSKTESVIGLVSDLDRNGSLLFRYPMEQDPCIAVHPPEGRIVTYYQGCTHLSCAVVYDKSEGGLFCPCHHGLFNLQGQPTAGPTNRPLPRITVEQRGDYLYATGLEV